MRQPVRVKGGQEWQLRPGQGQNVLLHFSGSQRPRRVQDWQSIRILDPQPFEPGAVFVNLRGLVVWVSLLDGPEVVATGYVPLCLFGPRFKLNGKGE